MNLCEYLPPHCWLGMQGMLLTLTPPRPACPAHSRGTLMGSDGGARERWRQGGSDSSVTLTRARCPLLQSGIAHPQCQKGEFIFLAPALPSAGYRGPPSTGSLSLCPEPLLRWPERDLLGRVGRKRKKMVVTST